MVLFDANTLSLLLHDKARIPNDPNTGQPVDSARGRLEYLVKTLDKAKEKIILPTPALSEFLVLARKDVAHFLDLIHNSPWFEVVSFDEPAAVELACSTLMPTIRVIKGPA
jgi:hypothetical protein